MSTPCPFRHELRTTLDDREAAAIIDDLRRGRGITISRAKELLGHPDERLFLAVCDIFRPSFVGALHKAIEERLATLLETEKDIGWNPVLDELARDLKINENERAKILAPWFRKADAASILDALKPFKAHMLFGIAAREIRSWSPELVGLILQRSESAAQQMGRNCHLTDAASVNALFQHIVRVAHRTRYSALPRALSAALQALFARIDKLPPEFTLRSLSIIQTGQGDVAAAFARALANNPGFTDAIGNQILNAMGDRRQIAAEMIRGRYCSVTTARRALKEGGHETMRLAVTKRPEFLRDPVIRSNLKQSKWAAVQRALLQSALPEEATALIEQIADTRPDRALRLLQEDWARGMAISAKTMARLLQLKNPAQREQALRTIADVRILSSPQDDQTTRRSIPRR